MRTLGDVPGIDGLASNSEVLPPSYTYTEVNPLGEVTADPSIDPLSAAPDDPFAYDIGFLDEPAAGGEGPGSSATNDPMQSSYLPTYDSSGTPPAVTTTGTSYTSEQLANAQTIADVGKKVGASDRDIQVALMAAMVESNLTNLDHGDRDSVGLFQQRDAWGSFEDRTTPAKAAEMFFLGGGGGQQGLLDIKDRDSRDMGALAQDVQVSAYPERYAQHQTDAALLFGSLGGDTTTGKVGHDPYGMTEIDGHTVDNLTAAALKAASKAYGKPLPITQGSHSTSVAASGTTHEGGGVIDITVPDGDWDGAVEALRKIGFAAWHRTPGQGPWPEHIHAVLIGDETLSGSAAQQVQSYINNDNGLEGSTPDDGPRQFIDNRFVWGAASKKQQDPTWRDAITKMARTYVGTPFKWGGKDYSGIDSEALLHNLYGQVGVDLPLMAHDIAQLGKPIDPSQAKPGDLIGWHDPRDGLKFGIYLTNGQLVEAGGPGRVVQLSELGTDALNTFGIPIQQLIGKAAPTSLARPAPGVTPSVYSNPGSVSVTTNPSTGHSMVEPHAAVTAPKKPKPSGVPITADDYQNKPRGPM